MQIATIAGNIGRDAETRKTQKGDAVTSFSVAVSEGRDKPTTWWDCSIWGQRGERVAQYLTKGSRVTVSGRFSTREHEGKTYLQITATDFALQGGGPQSGGNQGGGSAQGGYSQQSGGYGGPAPATVGDLEDEIPF